ncbi:MAG: ATP-binding protein [Planctomycetota bacterium]
MTSSTWTWTFDARIPSIASEGKKVVEQLLEQLNWHEWQEHDIFGIHLAMEEAVVNAIKHGNQDDASKFVDVVIRLNKEEVHLQVTDQGDGFVPSEVPDPTDDENLDLPSGRGLMLMRSFMTLVEYNDKGNSVRMEKRRTVE